jgi:hypothetical protein
MAYGKHVGREITSVNFESQFQKWDKQPTAAAAQVKSRLPGSLDQLSVLTGFRTNLGFKFSPVVGD